MRAGPVPRVLWSCLSAGLARATQPDRCRGRRLGPWGEASGSLASLLPSFPLQLPLAELRPPPPRVCSGLSSPWWPQGATAMPSPRPTGGRRPCS